MATQLERSDQAYHELQKLSARFDYFMAGLSIAATGYLAADLGPLDLGWNVQGLNVLAVVLALASALGALKRIEAMITTGWGMYARLLRRSRSLDVEIESWKGRAKDWYHRRNRLLYLAFLAHVVARVLEAYGAA